MPLPIGHAIIGLTTQNLYSQERSVFKPWKLTLFIILLANLPDIDVLLGLIFAGNGNAFHRGATHSLIFSLVMGYAFSHAWRFSSLIPKITFTNGSILILSHVLADHFFTSAPVSFFWPFENLLSLGYSGWGDVISTVFMDAYGDAGVILGCLVLIVVNHLVKEMRHGNIKIVDRFRLLSNMALSGSKKFRKLILSR